MTSAEPATQTTVKVSHTVDSDTIAEFTVRDRAFPHDATDIAEALRQHFVVRALTKRTWTDASAMEAMSAFPKTMAENAKSYVEARLEGYSPAEANAQLDPYTI